MLSAKQKEFCHQFIVDSNGTRAAVRSGYTKSAAAVTANRLLKNPDVQDLIEKLTAQKNKKLLLSAQQVLEETCRIAMTKSAKHSDRLKALELMGKHYNLWTESTPLETATAKEGATVVFYIPHKKPLPHEM